MEERATGSSRKNRGYEDLKRRILTCDLAPGAYLDETEVAATYGMSRPPLREIFRQLAGEGFLAIQENRGAQVTPMTHKTMRNFFMVAPMIYASVAELAAQHATAAQVDRLKSTQARFRAAITARDVAERATLNERFHAILGEMADNEYLMPSLARLLIDHTRIGMTFYNASTPRFAEQQSIAADQHDAMIEAIEACDPKASSDLAIAHWELSREQMQQFVGAPALNGTLVMTG
ncbi:GntR family transcriptional regulator [Rubellimicrobium rubrum]|uniref:GntR family transcriptional regulator n=1 Tax=Rubellimicrobium rubrum TaxID=2585369 RepID=A0A5C4MUG8_9RHOB|nr:GntR family transcriptional regulator [Rubellimicrobium rubrum]TNC48593.1 GntR family transcriptional regulator [Rubellimicrobium rubrum]